METPIICTHCGTELGTYEALPISNNIQFTCHICGSGLIIDNAPLDFTSNAAPILY